MNETQTNIKSANVENNHSSGRYLQTMVRFAFLGDKVENIFEKDGQQIKVITYDTPKKVLLEYFGGEMTDEDELCGCDGNGEEYHITTKDMSDNMKMSGCWGFCRGKSEIHLWHSKDVDMSELIHLLAHERGHMLNPLHRIHTKEEIKAEKYGDAARFAYDVAKILMGQI